MKSVSNFWVNLTAGLCFIAAIYVLHILNITNVVIGTPIALVISLIPLLLGEIFIVKSYKNSGLFQSKGAISKERTLKKMIGLGGTLVLMYVFYCLFPGYDADKYTLYFIFFSLTSMVILTVGYVYIREIDRRLIDPYDSLWHFGKLLSLDFTDISFSEVRKHFLSVILRAYFIAMMMMFFIYNLYSLVSNPDQYISEKLAEIPDIPILHIILYLYLITAAIDILYGVFGYVMTLKPLNSHIRSMDQTFMGWFVCLLCYPPFFDIILLYIPFLSHFFDGTTWAYWYGETYYIALIWGSFVIFFQLLETLGTMSFGIRFSNLCYRGLITTGLFRLTKHPQYIGKMLNRFFFYVPFLSTTGFWGIAEGMCAFSCLVTIYFLRAKTEERHLSQAHPEYVEYALWMNEHGLFSWFTKRLPFMAYSAERAKAGKLI